MTMDAFKQLGLSDALLKALRDAGFEQPREIQEKTIPLAMAGKDVIGGSATGSGKTLAFGASIIEHAKKGAGVQALILTPTRELAEQVAKEMHNFSQYVGLTISAVYGGVSIEPQIRKLEYADIVVGTPGRILDHLERRTLDLRKVKTLVLDEADRMLDMGFIDDVTKIIEACPKNRQTMLFSATVGPDLAHIADAYMKHPESVALENYVDPSKLKQVYYDVPQNMKFSLLLHLLKHEHPGLIMVFCNTQRNTDFLASLLHEHGIEAVAIHGGLTQAKRTHVMGHFRAERTNVLICTDVAARGLDIKNVSHVYNYDVPLNSKEYIHRVGRTARAGKDGIAISLVSARDYENFRAVLKNPDLHIEQLQVPTIEQVFIQFARSGRSGGRDRFSGRGGGRFGSSGGAGRSFGRSRSFGGRSRYGRPGSSVDGESRGRSFGRGRESGEGRGGGRFGSERRSSYGSRPRSSGRSFGARRRY